MSISRSKILLFLAAAILQLISINATGQGIIGLHAINERYVLAVDSNILSLIIVDVLLGGVVGLFTFPTHLYRKEGRKNDIHFIGVTSCDACLYIHVDKMHWYFPHSTEDHLLEIGPLERPLLDMAKDSNFTAFNTLSFERDVKPVWPFPPEYLNENHSNELRMLRSYPSGGAGYLAHQNFGVMRYQLDSRGKMIHKKGDIFFQSTDSITGINFSSTNKRLVAVGKRKAYVIDVAQKNTLPDDINVEEINLNDLCIKGRYRNSVLWDDDPTSQVMIVDGHDGKSMNGGVSIVLQKLSRSENGSWDKCEIVAGKVGKRVGWRDGCGSAARFTRPHDMMLLPESAKLVVTDIDNRAMRLVEPSPVSNDTTCVSTISYDDELMYTKVFPDSQEQYVNEGNNTISSYIKMASTGEEELLREPYIPETSIKIGRITYERAQAYCQSSTEMEKSDICTLEEIRTLFKYNGDGDHSTWRTKMLSNPFWTKASCEGCWKHRKGICTDEDPKWDSDYHMVAVGQNVDSQFPKERGLHTECLQDNEPITPAYQYIHVVCCGSRKDQNDSFISNVNEILENIEEKPLQFIVLVAFCTLFLFAIHFLAKTFMTEKKDVKYNRIPVVTSDSHITRSQSF